MFKVYISDSVYGKIVNAEEQRAMAGRSSLYKLLKQQPVHRLTQEDMGKLKAHPENVRTMYDNNKSTFEVKRK